MTTSIGQLLDGYRDAVARRIEAERPSSRPIASGIRDREIAAARDCERTARKTLEMRIVMHLVAEEVVDPIEAERVRAGHPRTLAFVGSVCGVVSPIGDEPENYRLGDLEPCVLCHHESCVSRVFDWESEGDALAEELAGRLQARDEADAEHPPRTIYDHRRDQWPKIELVQRDNSEELRKLREVLSEKKLRPSEPRLDASVRTAVLVEIVEELEALHRANVERCEAHYHPVAAWSLTDWMTAVTGEVGELASVVKNLRRLDVEGSSPHVIPETSQEHLGNEAADIVIYLNLLCARAGVGLAESVVRKFNLVSKERLGSSIRLETGPPPVSDHDPCARCGHARGVHDANGCQATSGEDDRRICRTCRSFVES